MKQKSSGELGPKCRKILAEAFGDENVGGQYSDKPVKVYFKKDGSVRLQITDLSAGAMMKIANLIKEEDLNLDL
jgi:hypothetical protein